MPVKEAIEMTWTQIVAIGLTGATVGLTIATSGYKIVVFLQSQKLGPDDHLSLAKKFTDDQERLYTLVQKLAPFVPKLNEDDQAEYSRRVDTVHFILRKGIDELKKQAKTCKYTVN